MVETAFSLPEVNVPPLGKTMLDFLIDRDQEESFIDFKETLSISKDSPFAKIAKDIFAFSNYGGGYILIGFKERKTPLDETKDIPPEERRRFVPVGLPNDYSIDQADLQTKFNAYSNVQIRLDYTEFCRTYNGNERKFAAIYIPASLATLTPVRDGTYIDGKGKTKQAFNKDTILFRRGTQSIIASEEEKAFIKKRSEKEGYKLSVLSGQPNLINETLYSNLFEVTNFPDTLWMGPLRYHFDKSKVPPSITYIIWNGMVLTFSDLSNPNNPLCAIIESNSIASEKTIQWLEDVNKQNVVMWLLNKELSNLASRLHLLKEDRKEKFYFASDSESRKETWVPKYRSSSSLTVAQRIWASQLKRYIWWHLAVSARFKYTNRKLFLRLSPTIMLTNDGWTPTFGPREGTVITRLTYNRYNDSYRNNLLFWASRFAEGKDEFVLADGKLTISAKPFEAQIGIGILHDRPTSEPIQETPQIEIIEDE
jgi:hypothetical protein